jgi:copper chaperone CopZ
VSRAEVSLRAKQAEVLFDPAQVTVEQMVEAVNRLGFRASQKASNSSAVPPSPRGK